MIDRDLAQLYEVETRRIKEQVRRNINRFPEDFMFELTNKEFLNWKSQLTSTRKETMGLRIPPFAFSEYGVVMLASVLNSERAIQVNIQIVRIFIQMREMLQTYSDIIQRIENIENRLVKHDAKFILFLKYLKKLAETEQRLKNQDQRNPIGFKRKGDNEKY